MSVGIIIRSKKIENYFLCIFFIFIKVRVKKISENCF